MDYTNIPSCALLRHGTVILRIKMELSTDCCQRKVCPVKGYPDVVRRLSSCEQCTRTRINSQNSDCDSGKVEKCRPYRSSAARSKYVNVCAAVCLLLLVSGLSPTSSAAPHRTRRMADQNDTENRNEVKNWNNTENGTWENPCDFDNQSTVVPEPYNTSLARKLLYDANNALLTAAQLKDNFSRLHCYESNTFLELIAQWKAYDYLRSYKDQSWYRPEVLPAEKEYQTPLSEEYINSLVANRREVLPAMYMGLKAVLAGLVRIQPDLKAVDNELANKIKVLLHEVQATLCQFYQIMMSMKLKIDPLYDTEVKELKNNILRDSLIVYRDTLNYLEYLIQVFNKIYVTVPNDTD